MLLLVLVLPLCGRYPTPGLLWYWSFFYLLSLRSSLEILLDWNINIFFLTYDILLLLVSCIRPWIFNFQGYRFYLPSIFVCFCTRTYTCVICFLSIFSRYFCLLKYVETDTGSLTQSTLVEWPRRDGRGSTTGDQMEFVFRPRTRPVGDNFHMIYPIDFQWKRTKNFIKRSTTSKSLMYRGKSHVLSDSNFVFRLY